MSGNREALAKAAAGSGPAAKTEGVPLDLRAQLPSSDPTGAPITILVEGVLDGARLSAGTNNGDGRWSLALEELDGLLYTPPPTGKGGTLTVRVLAREDELANTIAVFDVDVPAWAAAAQDTARREDAPAEPRTQETERLYRILKDWAEEEARRLTEIEDKWTTEVDRRLKEVETRWRVELESRLADAQAQQEHRLAKVRAEWESQDAKRLAQMNDQRRIAPEARSRDQVLASRRGGSRDFRRMPNIVKRVFSKNGQSASALACKVSAATFRRHSASLVHAVSAPIRAVRATTMRAFSSASRISRTLAKRFDHTPTQSSRRNDDRL